MNERIRELAEQARKKPMGKGWTYRSQREFEEKFAELIVKECISKIEEAAEYSPELYGVALDLHEHFGVENV